MITRTGAMDTTTTSHNGVRQDWSRGSAKSGAFSGSVLSNRNVLIYANMGNGFSEYDRVRNREKEGRFWGAARV